MAIDNTTTISDNSKGKEIPKLIKHLWLLLFFLIVCHPLKSQQIKDTLYREADVYRLLEQIEEDPMLQLEWLTSFHFHQLINEYRSSKKYKRIYWDHKLWMTSRNHNVYLLRDLKHLSHNQSKNNSFYSGRYPEDRVEYVTYQSKEFESAGYENCNFSGFSFSLDRINQGIVDNQDKEAMNKLAKSTAEDGFESWKNSMGHNQNMLNEDHIAHGTSFVFGHDGVYATSVFANKQKYYTPDNLFLPFLTSIINPETKGASDYHEITPYQNEFRRLKYKHFYGATLFFKEQELFSNKALYNLSQLNKLPKNKKELNKVYRKSRGLRGFFELFFNEVQLQTHTFQMSREEFKHLKGTTTIQTQLQSFLNRFSTEIKSWGGDILVDSNGDQVTLEIRMLFLVRKG